MKKKYMISVIIVSSLALLSVGCAQKEMALSTSSEISNSITANEQKISRAYEDQWDVLAQDELQKAEYNLKDAKKHALQSSSTIKASRDLADFDRHYMRAQALADARAPKVQGLLSTRREVIGKGVRARPEEKRILANLDNEFRDLAEKQTIDSKDFSKLQTEYFMLGNRAVKRQVLGSAHRKIEEAKNYRAKKHAPRALNQAELDFKNAENVMDANVNQPEVYGPAVHRANRSAAMLEGIVTEQRRVNYNLDEMAAQRLVEQSGQIDRMNFDLNATNAALNQTLQNLNESEKARQNQMLMDAENERAEQDRKLYDQQVSAENEKRFQEALTSAQEQFSPTEADVYRQGDKILIRLKSIGFETGKSEIPEKSKSLLERVTQMAEDLDAQRIVIEGHTDSVGAAEVNETISQKRAESVLNYMRKEGGIESGKLQAVGYGFEKPVSSNKTKAGRAQNRRVDIWISPSEPSKAE